MQGARQPLSSRAISLVPGSFTVRWQGTSCCSSFVSKVLGANYNRANNFHPVADKFAMCTGQEVTFEPTSNAHARVDYNTLYINMVVQYIDLITIKPNPAAFYLIDMGTTIPIAITVMSTHIFVIDVYASLSSCIICRCVGAVMHYSYY